MDVAALTVSLAVDDIIDNLTKIKHCISCAQVINSFRLSPFFSVQYIKIAESSLRTYCSTYGQVENA